MGTGGNNYKHLIIFLFNRPVYCIYMTLPIPFMIFKHRQRRGQGLELFTVYLLDPPLPQLTIFDPVSQVLWNHKIYCVMLLPAVRSFYGGFTH